MWDNEYYIGPSGLCSDPITYAWDCVVSESSKVSEKEDKEEENKNNK